MRARDPDERGRVASTLELLTDLCFVVAVAQAATALHHGLAAGHGGTAVLGYAMAFFAIWWAWLNFTWFASAYDNDDVAYRLLTILQIVGVLTLAAGIKGLTAGHFGVTVTGYVIMRVGLVVQWLRAARQDPPRRATCRRYALGIASVQLGWLAFWPASRVPSLVVPLFAVLVLAEVAVPVLAERAGATTWHPHHIAERYGLFFIIVLGETILSSTTAVQTAFTDTTTHPVVVVIQALSGVLIVFSLWWLYFSREPAEVLARARESGSRMQYLWGFGHYLIFSGTAAVGAGLAARTEYAGHPGSHSVRVTTLAVSVPVAVLLVTMWVIHLRPHDRSPRAAAPMLGTAVLVLLSSVLLPDADLVIGVLLALLVVIETQTVQSGWRVAHPR